MTKDEKILELEDKLSQALQDVNTHKKASYEQSKKLKYIGDLEQRLKIAEQSSEEYRIKKIELEKKVKDTNDLENRLKIAEENVETHKKASFEQSKHLKELQLQRDTIKRDYEKLEKAYNFIAQLFDEYNTVFKNTIGQLSGLSQATVMLEKNLTEKIKNFNKGVE